MKKSIKVALPTLGVLALLLHASCASIVKKPEITQVKRAAIISLYANDKVPRKGGRGFVSGWDQTFKNQVAGEAIHIFSGELTKIGWQLANPDAVVQSPEYQSAFKPKAMTGVSEDSSVGRTLAFMQKVGQSARERAFFTPSGMFPIQLSDKATHTTYYGNASKDPKKMLADFAKKLNVDAVILVQLDYCYEGGTMSMLGTGEAVITAASSVKAVNRDGEVVIDMPGIPECGGKRFESKGSATMINGDLMFAKLSHDGFRKMLVEATEASAEQTIATIQDAIR